MIVVVGAAFLLLAAVGVGVAVIFNNAASDKQSPPKDGAVEDGSKDREESPPGRRPEKPTGKTPSSVDPELVTLPADKQAKVNKAIDRAVAFLRKEQKPNGQWQLTRVIRAMEGPYDVGLTALPALTLLECGVTADDTAIQKAATFVRQRCSRLNYTYDIALAILFLDRLNDPDDKELIQGLALRLVAGQTNNGGWSYKCPLLKKDERDLLVSALKVMPLPKNKLELIETPKEPDPRNKLTLEDQPDVKVDRPDSTKLVLEAPETPRPKLELELEKLPPNLKKLPVLQVPDDANEKFVPHRSDNSNTQFAILGLLAARRHDLPLDRCLGLIVKRFRTSQLPSGGWNYGYLYTVGMKPDAKIYGKATMTCAGLLGLAVGRSLANDIKAPGALGGRDPAVAKALRALGTGLKTRGASPWKDPRSGHMIYNMYLLWSVERVAVIYNLKRIAQVDWYSWGTDILLEHQSREDGSWLGEGYHGSDTITDTSLALLFLKRVNLAKDLKLTLEDS
jgi:hypothetical protein